MVKSAPPLVAVVDDEESVRTAIGRLLRSAGFSVETFSSGLDFLRSMRNRLPDCLVLDLRMPTVSGFDVQRSLSESGSGLPVVIITGDDSVESRARALGQGAKAYLRKPVDDAMLMDAIQSAMGADSEDRRG
jgi:FixJ family two-component response regulator